VSDISEALREHEGYGQVADQQQRQDQSRGILKAHSRSKPFKTNAAMAKKAIVKAMKIRSCIRLPPGHRTPSRLREPTLHEEGTEADFLYTFLMTRAGIFTPLKYGSA
jgi:hypothetical protein